MALNLRTMYYSKRYNENWKGTYEKDIRGSISKSVYNTSTVPNVRSANPIKHWRRQSTSGGVHSKLHVMNYINRPGGVTISDTDPCLQGTKVVLDNHLSKNVDCCDYTQKKALKLTRHHVDNSSFKYGNNNLDGDTCDNSNRYYYHSGSYLERKKNRILRKEKIDSGVENVASCKLAQQCMTDDEKYFQIHGFNRVEKAVDPKCKC